MPAISPTSHLGTISVEKFLEEYWQKKPLLVKNFLPDFSSPISAEEIAGLTLEEEVNSRLIIASSPSCAETPAAQHDWQLTHGPLPESIFAELPENNWSILVQNADSLHPDINALLDIFKFIPHWRLDDIMVSLAAPDGGVGPHFDYYDVFLLQGEGTRTWRLGQYCNEHTALVPDQALKILEHFEESQSFEVQPGDLLYIPPKLAHWGSAITQSITFSVGFRAPSHADLLLDFSEDLASNLTPDQRYNDAPGSFTGGGGQITPQVIDKVSQILRHYLMDNDNMARWFGELMTRPANFHNTDGEFSQGFVHDEEHTEMADAVTLEDMRAGVPFILHPYARFAYYIDSKDEQRALCFINGLSWPCSRKLVEAIESKHAMVWSDFDDKDREILAYMSEQPLFITTR